MRRNVATLHREKDFSPRENKFSSREILFSRRENQHKMFYREKNQFLIFNYEKGNQETDHSDRRYRVNSYRHNTDNNIMFNITPIIVHYSAVRP